MSTIISLSQDLSKIISINYDEICRICQPLFQNSPVDYFEYVRFYDSGEMLLLGTHPEGMIKAFANNLFPSQEELDSFQTYGVKVACLSHEMELPAGVSVLNSERYQNNITNAADHHIYHRIYFIERKDTYYKIYGYGVSKSSKSILNYYLNSLSFLEKFVKHFEWHAQGLIEADVKKNIIVIPNYHQKISLVNCEIPSVLNDSELEFKQNGTGTIAQHYDRITSREKECLSLVAQGYTMKNAARKLQISPRTVEQHLRNIKEKYGLNTKNQLVEIWHELLC